MSKIILILSLTFSVTFLKAAVPTWSVNPLNYQYTMTVTGVANLSCEDLANNNNLIGAFVNGVCRGVVQTNVIVNNKNLAFLTVYSNVNTNETVTFKIYNSVNDVVYEALDVVTFNSSAVVGTSTNPYVFRDNHAPIDILFPATTILENTAISSQISIFSSTDIDVNDVHTYSLVSGLNSRNNGMFTITNNQLILNASLNINLEDTLRIRVKTLDQNGCSFEKLFNLVVINTNDAPTALQLSNLTFVENVNNPIVGQFSAIDDDPNETFSYSLVAGVGSVDNSNFSINGTSLSFVNSANFEIKNTYTIRCKVTDAGGLSYEKSFIINVIDANDNPTMINLSSTKVYENEIANKFIAKLTTNDEDVADQFVYTFSNLGSNNNTSFKISNDTLYANEKFDFEVKNQYFIYLTTTDNSGTFFSKNFTILIRDSIDSPTDMMINNSSILENKTNPSFVGKLFTVDANVSVPSTYTYSLVAGIGSNDNTSFIIKNDTVYSNVLFDYETKKSYTIRVKSTLTNGMFIEKPYAISILDDVDLITDILISNDSISENNANIIEVALLSSVSQDVSASYSYSLVSGNGSSDNTSFSIVNNKLNFTSTSNYEVKKTYLVRISAKNTLNQSFEKEFIINIKDENDNPTAIQLSNNIIAENAGANFTIGNLSTIDQDVNDLFTYTFDNSVTNNNNLFSLLTSGVLKANQSFDFETKNSYTISVKTTDKGGLTFVKQFTISVIDVNETPVSLNLSNHSILENKAIGSLVGSLNTIDVDALDVATYSLVSGIGSDDNASFSLVNNEVFSSSIFNFESKNSYKIRVRTTDVNGLFLDSAFLINILNINETPTLITLSKLDIDENTSDSSIVCNLTTTDEEGGSNFIYTLVPGTDDSNNGSFTIKQDKLIVVKSANFENKNSYLIRLKTTDAQGAFLEMPFKITINDVNERPSIYIEEYELFEFDAVGTEIGIVTVEELDNNQSQTLEIVSADSIFSIDAISGMLKLNKKVDYELQNEYLVTVITRDNGLPILTDTAFIKISINDQVELEVFPSSDFVSPNGDGKNDYWKINNVEIYKDFSLTILDEYGQTVYAVTSNYNNEWDAKRNETPLPNGNYYYYFKKESSGDLFKGIITVLR